MDYLNYDHLTLRYEPFPIGLAKPAMAPAALRPLVAAYPPQELFEYIPKIGKKYSLSERNNPDKYRSFVEGSPLWRDFHRWIKSEAFIAGVVAALKQHHVDLGVDRRRKGVGRLKKLLSNLGKGKLDAGEPGLSARFEFSMLPADGGSVIPHTDAPGKLITLVVSMVREGEWDPALGGGTEVNRPKDARLAYNELNRQAEFADVEELDTFEFTPNQAVIFVKTFNSWHCVRPMTGDGLAGDAQDADDQHRGGLGGGISPPGAARRRPRARSARSSPDGGRPAPVPAAGERPSGVCLLAVVPRRAMFGSSPAAWVSSKLNPLTITCSTPGSASAMATASVPDEACLRSSCAATSGSSRHRPRISRRYSSVLRSVKRS